jgi:formylglycine-generating enzyme required for sulfatase activity
LLQDKINNSRLILFLVSAYSLNNEFCDTTEMKLAFSRLEDVTVLFIPVLIRSVGWQDEPLLKGRSCLPIKDGKPCDVTSKSWDNKEEAFLAIVNGIKESVRSFQEYIQKKEQPKDLNKPKLKYQEVLNIRRPIVNKNHAEKPFQYRKVESPMIRVIGGSFEMGSNRYDDEKPIHKVFLNDFLIGMHLVTQDLWREVMGDINPSNFKNSLRMPVETVSWDDVQQFLKKLNALTGKQYRLPTEAEWEYSARGGKVEKGKNYTFSGSNTIEHIGWNHANAGLRTKPVGLLRRNGLGLYDMSGNVWEWVEDNWHPNYNSAPTNGLAWISAFEKKRVIRGGSWANTSDSCRVSHREGRLPSDKTSYLGFRLALNC